MNNANISNKNTNRRLAFRVYEQVNLFYQKIDSDQINEPNLGFDSLFNGFKLAQEHQKIDRRSSQTPHIASLPLSESNENDSLNVNLSATGIAFTCKDVLVPGDLLALRILLLSSMTVITTCCKVVYCKLSNPYEEDQYPYLVGGHFVNLTTEDSQLLTQHLQKRRKRQILIYSLLSMIALTFLSIPDIAFGFLLDLGHHAIGITLHAIHLLVEVVELNIDHLVEHSLHTDFRQTQIIVFYIMLGLGLLSFYIFWKVVPPLCLRFFKNQLRFWSRKRASLLYIWGEQSLLEKIKICGIGIAVVACYVFFAF